LEHAEVGEQERDRLAPHRGAAVGVHGQPAGLDPLLLDRLADQRPGELCRLALLHGPADAVAAEHVEDHVQVEAGPFRRPLQLRNVPRPDLVRPLGKQLRPCVGRVGELVAPFPHPAEGGGKEAVHRPLRAQVLILVKQRRPHLRRRAVDEPLRVQ